MGSESELEFTEETGVTADNLSYMLSKGWSIVQVTPIKREVVSYTVLYARKKDENYKSK